MQEIKKLQVINLNLKMLSLSKLFAPFAALLLAVTIGTTIKNLDQKSIQDLIELAYSNSSTLSHQAGGKEEKTTVVDFSSQEISLEPSEPCECSAKDLKQALALFNGPDPPFLPAYRDGKAQTIKLPDQVYDEVTCRRADGTSACRRLSYIFTDPKSRLELKTFPHKGLFWDTSLNQITLQPLSTDPTGVHKVLVTAYLPSFSDVLETAEIAYVVHPAPGDLLPNVEQPESQNTGQPSRILSPGEGYCTNPTTMLNLFNTAALAEQSSFWLSQTASTGCDGEVMQINKSTYAWDHFKIVISAAYGTSSNPQWWKITFQQPTSIKTTLFINRDNCCTDRFPAYTATVGNSTDVTQNPVCVPIGAMTDGGWYPCPNSMIGTTFGVYTESNLLNFMEAMAYSQEAINLNPGITMSFLGTNTEQPASNAIQKQVVLKVDDSARQKCVAIQAPAGGLATQSIKFPAQILIRGVMLLPGYKTSASDWTTQQTNVAIYGGTVGGTKQLCGITQNYYSTTQYEVACNIQANEIILVQQNAAYSLRFCGFGALADCDCGQSSFDKLLFTTPPATPFASATSISVKSTDSVQQIQFNLQAPDTVSSVCGNADGISKCGTRQLSFKDILNSLVIQKWPYRGYSFDALTSEMTLDPAQADAASVIAVTISLSNFPAVFMTQNITAVVEGGKTNPKTCISSYILDATINMEAVLELPALPQTSYSVTSQQDFAATFDANVLKVLSKSESDVGKQYVQVSQNSPTLKCTSKVQISFRSSSTNSSKAEVIADKTTNQPQNISQDAQNISEGEQATLIAKVECHIDENNQVICVNPANGFKFYFDPISKQLMSGSTVYNDTKTTEKKIVTLKISPINSKGEVTFKFSEEVDVEALANTSDISAARLLRQKQSKQKQKVNNSTTASRYSYLLSPAHLNITLNHSTYVNGSLQSGDVDASRLNFDWYAKKITPDSIVIQFVFENPLLISSEAGFQDKLNIQLLPPSFKYFTSLQTSQLIENPLRNVTRVLPRQVQLGRTIQNLEDAASTVQTVGQSSVAGNVAMQVILSGSFNQMWSMVNAMQITLSFNEMELPMPGNINLAMTYASDLASFNVFPTSAIMDYLFKFSETDLPGVGFESLGTTNKSLVLYLGSEYLLMHLMLLSYLFYGLTLFFSKYDILCKWFKKKLEPNLIWQQLFTFLIESYFSFTVGILLRFEEPKFVTVSDQYDFALACVFCLVVILLPLTSYLLLSKNETKLDQEEFKQKFDSFYSGLATNSQLKRKQCMLMMSWFLCRRLITAINLVPMRHETKFVQITINIWLCMIDACLKLHWDPYESKINGHMQKINDIVVLFMSEFMFCFTDLTRSEEDKYLIGWVYLGIFYSMVGFNIQVMVSLALRDAFKILKREIFVCRRDRILEKNEERKQKRDVAERLAKADAKALKRAINKIRLQDAEEERERQQKEERMMRIKQQARAIVRQRLEQISEVDEDSSRKISNSEYSIRESQVSASQLSKSALKRDQGSQTFRNLRELQVEPEVIDIAALMREEELRKQRDENHYFQRVREATQMQFPITEEKRSFKLEREFQQVEIDMAALMREEARKEKVQQNHFLLRMRQQKSDREIELKRLFELTREDIQTWHASTVEVCKTFQEISQELKNEQQVAVKSKPITYKR